MTSFNSCLHKNAIDFFQKIGIHAERSKIMLVGGSTLTVYLAKMLEDSDIKITIIEQNKDRCEELSNLLPNAMIINANATENNVLLEEGIETVDAFAALTNYDEENILLALYANKCSKAKVFTKITRMTYDNIVDELPLVLLSIPSWLTAHRILQHVRAMENSKEAMLKPQKLIGNKVEALSSMQEAMQSFLAFLLKSWK